MSELSKVAVIGLDCADPILVFQEFWEDLPNLRRLIKVCGKMKSTIPPITVPAWMSMMTGKDPGTLGIYGFRNRKDYSYDSLFFANSRLLKHPTVWELLSEKGLRSIVLGVPMTYPPKPLNGCMITSFLTPSIESDYTYPKSLKHRIAEWVGEYMLDVPNFRTNDKERLLKDIYEMTRKRFEVARHLVVEEEWDFFMMVEMGPDRIHHGFWAYHDAGHPKHDPTSPYRNAIREYYMYLDEEIGKLVELFPSNTKIVFVSDHGVQRMDGGIAVNDWLIEKGYLVLKEKPSTPTRIGELIKAGKIDWSKTRAWGEGGYYGRIFINVEDREPEGVVPKEEYESFRNQLIAELTSITDEHGRNIGTVVYKPEEIYGEVRNIPPDLIVYFGNLSWRSIGSVGNETIWLHENDTGPDDANHSQYGMIASSDDDELPADILDFQKYVLSSLLER